MLLLWLLLLLLLLIRALHNIVWIAASRLMTGLTNKMNSNIIIQLLQKTLNGNPTTTSRHKKHP
jgi:predicted histidine transporter YuiF (NhaC family)